MCQSVLANLRCIRLDMQTTALWHLRHLCGCHPIHQLHRLILNLIIQLVHSLTIICLTMMIIFVLLFAKLHISAPFPKLLILLSIISYNHLAYSSNFLIVSIVSAYVLKTVKETLSIPGWHGKILEEINDLYKNRTRELVDLFGGKKCMKCKLVFAIKLT